MSTTKKRKEKPWNRCDVCGKFIPFDHFSKGAIRYMTTPDTALTSESYTTLCINCNTDRKDEVARRRSIPEYYTPISQG